MAYGVYSDRGYREHILERNKNTNKTEVFTQEDQTFTGRKTFLSGVTTSDLEVQTVEVSDSLKVKGKDITEINGKIEAQQNEISSLKTTVAGKANSSHTHTKSQITDFPNNLVDENSIKTIMKPNYTTGRIPAGVYNSGETVTVSASITTTRGNPVFISYSGDFNSIGSGDTTPWVYFSLYADDVLLLQRISVDASYMLNSDNTSFAGNALAVLSAGSHTIRLDAELKDGSTGQIQFQEQENYVNLVAFEL